VLESKKYHAIQYGRIHIRHKFNKGAGMMNRKKTLLAIAVGVFLAGCGGGGYQAPSTTSGKSLDGYLNAATVLCDTNNNGIADAGETTVPTNDIGDFVFSPACASTLVSSGGTSTDTGVIFTGMTKAPAGSAFITPLTTLMAGGLTAAQVAAALGLPLGTDVTRIDPMLLANFDLQKKTLAIQQIIQQAANTMGALALNASPDAQKAIYTLVANAVVATLLANPDMPLITTSGTVSSALVSDIVVDSVAKVAASSDELLASAKVILSTYSGSNIAELISSAIVAQAQILSSATTVVALTNEAKALQSNPTIANTALLLAPFLITANSNLDLTATGASLATLVTATGSAAQTAAGTILKSTIDVQAVIAGITSPAINPATLATITDYLYVSSNQIELNGDPYSSEMVLSSFNTLSFAYGVSGTPIPVNALGAMTAGVRIGIELTDTFGKGQVLQVILDQADVTLNGAGELSIDIPADALMHVYGRTSSGVTANYDAISYTNADQLFVATTNGTTKNLTLNAEKIVSKIAASQASFAALPSLKGTFNLRMVISNLSLRNDPVNATTLVNQLAITVNGSSQPPVNGLGIQGVVTLQ
jgi:hypothetical protein